MSGTILFCPVRESPATLKLALAAHRDLDGVAERWYYDDNDVEESSRLLTREKLLPKLNLGQQQYDRSGPSHQWPGPLVSRIGRIRNHAIAEFLKTDAPALFIVDSDLILNQQTVTNLEDAPALIASEVFWSQWQPGSPWMPNVWDAHFYGFFGSRSVVRLQTPGWYEVNGLGACTLIRREALESGVNYTPVRGVDIAGEDRWFCIRAAARDISLIASSHLSPFHIYRGSQLDEAKHWRERGCDPNYFSQHWLTDSWKSQVAA